MANFIIKKPALQTLCIHTDWLRNHDGYGVKCRKGVLFLAHRVAYCEHHGITLTDIKSLMIRHKCDNPSCVNPEHLEPGTNADNVRDMMERGRSGKKITREQAEEIRGQHATGKSLRALAQAYGISKGMVCHIVKGRRW